MSDKKLAILAVVAAVMVIVAVVQSRISSGPAESETPGYLIPGLNVARIGSIVIGKGDDVVTLNRLAGRFVVANKDNYPAKVSEINNLLTKCQEIRWSQIITGNPANHEDLGVAEQNANTVVKFLTPEPNSTILAGVVVGKTREAGEGTYVRLLSGDKASSDKVYLVQDMPRISSSVMGYIEQGLISCEFEDIESVTVSSLDGEFTLKAKQDGEDIVLENTPEGKKLKAKEAKSVFTALTDLRFEDVGEKTTGRLFDRRFVCRLKDSTVYTLEIAQKDGKTYAVCSADFTDEIPQKERRVESEEELKDKEAKLLAWDKAKEFTVKHRGWIYEIADWKAKNLTKKLSDLLEDDSLEETLKAVDPNSAEIGGPADLPDISETLNIEDANTVKAEQ